MTRTRRRGSLLAPIVVLAAIAMGVPAGTSAAEGEDTCGAASNPIVCENALPGAPPSSWQVKEVGDSTIQGYATSMSLNVGQTEQFKINTSASSYHIEILRLGYYGGNGAHVIAANVTPTAHLPQTQPECLKEPSTGLVDCGNWGVSAQWTVPSNAVSGVYIALLTREDTGGKSQIPFVVRNDSSHSEILLQTSDATWEAYNAYGGNSLYSCTVSCPPGEPEEYKGAYAVSYNRPFDGSLATDSGASYLYRAEYQMMRFLEKNGYNVSYTSESEVDHSGVLLKNHKIFMSSGHDEYWSAGQRANVEAAREAGVSLAFFSGNEVFWKTRWAASTASGTETPYRTLITYKETHFQGPVDPKDPPTWTGAWRDPRGSPPADGGHPENALTGQQFEVNSGTSEITVPSQYSKLRLWRNTAVAGLGAGQTLTLAPKVGTLGYEWDEDVDNGFRPGGEFDLSSTSVSEVQAFNDFGSNTTGASGTHHLTLYRAPSGALVFGAGTVQWAWGLDNTNAWSDPNTDPNSPPPDPNMQQFTVNLLAEMGAQPGSLSAGLVAATRSTDTTPPTSTITSPAKEATLQDGTSVTISGTASDTGGGVVAGVEVSTDNGVTWHPATLTTAAEQSVKWSYTWAAHGYPSTTIKSRAVDDSSNLESPSAGTQVKVSCPCSIWGNGVTPSEPDSGDSNSVEVGVKFTSEVFGQVTGVRFYKSAANTGTHIGNLWNTNGELLATATFTSETASGWQQVNFSKPVDVFPNTTYVASYWDPSGHFAVSPYYFYTPPATGGHIMNSGPLHALPANTPPQNGAYVSENGVYFYNNVSAYPNRSYHGTNYWVDPVVMPGAVPGQVTNVKATGGSSSVGVTWTAPSSGGPVTKYTITPFIGSTAQTATTVTGTPPETGATITGLNPGTSYTFTVQASNPNGSGPASEHSNSVTLGQVTAPSAPTAVTASAATSQALVSWTAPVSNGGSSITSYVVTPFVGSSAQKAIEVSPSATSTIVKGLSNGTNYTFKVTATNSAGESPPSAASNAVTPQNTIFDFATPATIDSGDGSAVEVGVKFRSEVAGSITGIRFYKASANTGTHIGSLWNSSGTLLQSATFTAETSSGWQQVNFPAPVQIAANTTYVAGYLAPNGHYSDTSSGFATSGVNNPPLSALANSVSADGVYSYTTTSTFPTSTFNSTNYWVDVDFEPTTATTPSAPTNVTASAGNTSAEVTWTAPANGGSQITSYTITPFIGTEAQPATTIKGNPPNTSTTIIGLSNGTSYTFKVSATNEAGTGPTSSPSNAVTPATTPSAPTNVKASAGNTSAEVTWTAPANGGSQITSYTVTPFIGTEARPATTVEAPATSTTITGLSNGTSYTFKVTATNAIGTGPASSPSNAVTPATTPSAPTNVKASAANASAEVTWTAPANGGSEITSYTVTPFIGTEAQPATTIKGNPPATSATVTGLSNGTSYTFKVSATNEAGTGPTSSPSNAVTPATTPSAPTNVKASAGNTSAEVTWTAPANGGSQITSYTVTPFIGTEARPATTVEAPATSTTITGLSNGTSYTFKVTATNAIGTGPASSPSNAVTPATTPSAPTNVKASAANASAEVTWTAPANGGSEITSYTVTPFIGTEAQPATTIKGNPPATSATVTGLSNGTSYTFKVTATNAIGTGPASSPSNAVTPATTPSAPTNVKASAGNTSAEVTWTAPANGGSQITSYTVTPFIGTEAQTPTTIKGNPPDTSTTITGLSNGTTYTFKVSATNEAGTGPASSPSNAVTPATTPSAPTKVKASAGDASAEVTWTAPADGGSQITSYTIAPFVGTEARPATTVEAPATSATVSGLSNGTTYTFKVTATNAIGAGPSSSASNAVTPATTPSAPTNVKASAGNASAEVTWTAPPNGGSQITSYTVTPFIGTEPQPATTVEAPATSTTVTGLTNGTTYTFTVTASSEAGTGPASTPSNAITPATTPSAPTNVTATAANVSAEVSWTAPANGGSQITSYTITPFIGTEAQPATTIKGHPPNTSTTITGLTNGTTYTFKVTATSEAGTGPASSASNAVTPATTPSAPANVTATAGNASAKVKWTVPADGGNPITSYTVTPFIGTEAQPATIIKGNPPSTSTTITGLSNGTTYTFTVTASNEAGTGAASSPSNAVTPATTPSTPTNVKASAANASAEVTWTAPANGGSQITSYTITPFIGTEAQTPTTIKGNPPATSTTITGLTNGTTYTFNVTATNEAGTGAASSPSNAVTPATTPSAPTNVKASAANAGAEVTWTAPANGGSQITSYTITPFIGTEAQTPTTIKGNPPATSTTITGLSNATTYTFTVMATNEAGKGPPSSQSNAVTPQLGHVLDVNTTVEGDNTVTTPTFTTAAANEQLFAFVASAGPAGAGKQTVKVSGASLTWTLVQRANSQSGDAEIWTATTTKQIKNKAIKSDPKANSYDQSLTVISMQLSNGAGSSVAGGASSGEPSVSLLTTEEGSVAYAVGEDSAKAVGRTPGPNQVILHQWIDTASEKTLWSQSLAPGTSSGAVVTLNDAAPTSDPWNMAAVEILGQGVG